MNKKVKNQKAGGHPTCWDEEYNNKCQEIHPTCWDEDYECSCWKNSKNKTN